MSGVTSSDTGHQFVLSNSLTPTGHQRLGNTQLIEDARDDEIDHLRDAVGAMIETGRRRQHDRAHVRELEHVVEVNGRERRFSGHQNQLSPLLERHVGGAFDQIVAGPAGDGGKRSR